VFKKSLAKEGKKEKLKEITKYIDLLNDSHIPQDVTFRKECLCTGHLHTA